MIVTLGHKFDSYLKFTLPPDKHKHFFAQLHGKKNSSQENKKSTKPLQIIVVEKHNEKASRATSHAITIRAAQNSRVTILVSQVGLTTSQYDMINLKKFELSLKDKISAVLKPKAT